MVPAESIPPFRFIPTQVSTDIKDQTFKYQALDLQVERLLEKVNKWVISKIFYSKLPFLCQKH
jgi:hypothetical protein